MRSRLSWAFAALAAIGAFVAVVLLVVMGAPARAPRLGRAGFESSRVLDVVPFPGTPDAAPGTRIDFPARTPAQLVWVRVVGSRSGRHSGALTAQPDGRGTQFAPDDPFATIAIAGWCYLAAAGVDVLQAVDGRPPRLRDQSGKDFPALLVSMRSGSELEAGSGAAHDRSRTIE